MTKTQTRYQVFWRRMSGILLVFFLTIPVLTKPVFGFDTIALARRIGISLSQLDDRRYATLAFSRIQGPLEKEKINGLIDFTENEIVQQGRFKVIDRSKLQLILQEQKFNLSGMVSQDEYKELGKLLGVDLFVYGRYYMDAIVFKAIDVESSAIVWADIFQLEELTRQSLVISNMAEQVAESLRKQQDRLKGNQIDQISFWNIRSEFDDNRLIDFLSVSITKDRIFQVVDRDNLKLILEEQKLSMEDFIDEQTAKRMGELYGVDAFIYGRITSRQDGWIGSLKMLNIYSGVIEWAKTLRLETVSNNKQNDRQRPSEQKSEMVFVEGGVFIMGSNQGPRISSPEFRVPLQGFYIDRTEVSNGDYYRFVKRFKHRPPPSWPGGVVPEGREDEPVVKVSWYDAKRYCQTQRKRLPREAEWEKAFRGENGHIYPWSGTQFRPRYARTVESGVLGPAKVDAVNRDVSPYGVMHMAGNVREWVYDYLEPYPGSGYTATGRGYRVIRGGSWAKNKEHAVGWYRDGSNPNYGWEDVGFRCARSAR